ncbi:MAG: type II toxin-antitoxin system VapC family toxin [Candidatus Thorarchaeota archaeon]
MTLLSLDTSFLIDFLADDPSAVDKMKQIESDGNMIAVSSVVMYELLVLSAGDRKPNKTQKAINVVESLLSRIGIIWSFEPDTARLAAEIQRTQMTKGRPVSVRDLFIAASALTNGCNVVVTRNVRDFEVIDGLRVETY